jgi:hypothetical protein
VELILFCCFPQNVRFKAQEALISEQARKRQMEAEQELKPLLDETRALEARAKTLGLRPADWQE